jgi:hypothetical protein
MRPLVGEIPLQGEVPFGQACEFAETIGTNSVQSRICPRSCLSQSCQTSMPVTRRHWH